MSDFDDSFDYAQPKISQRNRAAKGRDVAARRLREQQFCKRGHEFTVENTYVHRGMRTCKKCRAIRERARRHNEQTAPLVHVGADGNLHEGPRAECPYCHS